MPLQEDANVTASHPAPDFDPPGIPFILDIGGEGRHPAAWNLNPRTTKSVGSQIGQRIPRLIRGRGECIPLASHSVDVVIVERTPLRAPVLREILRVARPGALVVLRHAELPWFDPHRHALRLLPGQVSRSAVKVGDRLFRETTIRLGLDAANAQVYSNACSLS